MKRAELAAEIASVLEARGKTHGDAVRQHEIQARLLTAYLQGRGLMDDGKRLEAFDAAQFTDLMKTSRIACGDHREVDHYRDKMGYAAISCEAATEVAAAPSWREEAARRLDTLCGPYSDGTTEISRDPNPMWRTGPFTGDEVTSTQGFNGA